MCNWSNNYGRSKSVCYLDVTRDILGVKGLFDNIKRYLSLKPIVILFCKKTLHISVRKSKLKHRKLSLHTDVAALFFFLPHQPELLSILERRIKDITKFMLLLWNGPFQTAQRDTKKMPQRRYKTSVWKGGLWTCWICPLLCSSVPQAWHCCMSIIKHCHILHFLLRYLFISFYKNFNEVTYKKRTEFRIRLRDLFLI